MYFCGRTEQISDNLRDVPLSKTHLRWKLTSGWDAATLDAVFALFRDGIFAVWERACGLTFEPAASNQRADIEIMAKYIDGPGGILAQAMLPGPKVQTQEYDTNKNWTTLPGRGGMISLQTVARHETGHTIGLYHDDPPRGQRAIMEPTYDANISELQPRDIARAQALYGPPVKKPEEPVPGLPKGVILIVPEGTEVQIQRV